MHVQELGHVVLKVRDAQRAERFYGDTLGIPVAGRSADPVPMIFFTLGHHHDFAVMELGQHGPSPDRHTAGLAHVAFKVGDSLDFEPEAGRYLVLGPSLDEAAHQRTISAQVNALVFGVVAGDVRRGHLHRRSDRGIGDSLAAKSEQSAAKMGGRNRTYRSFAPRG